MEELGACRAVVCGLGGKVFLVKPGRKLFPERIAAPRARAGANPEEDWFAMSCNVVQLLQRCENGFITGIDHNTYGTSDAEELRTRPDEYVTAMPSAAGEVRKVGGAL